MGRETEEVLILLSKSYLKKVDFSSFWQAVGGDKAWGGWVSGSLKLMVQANVIMTCCVDATI